MYKHPVLQKTQDKRGISGRIADAIASFCGDMKFVYIHIALFSMWIITQGFGFDAFPFNFLTMTVSLEAIFLSTFLLISQNRQTATDRATLEHNADESEQLLALQEGQNKELALQTEILQRLDEHITGQKSLP